MDKIEIKGARIHNLKNIDVSIPKNKIVLITGVSGSGKSSLAFDTIFNEGLRRYMQAVGYPSGGMDEQPFDLISGLSPTIAVEQRTTRVSNPRSTVGTKTIIYNLLRMIYAIEGEILCPICKIPVNRPEFECEICGMKADAIQIKNFSFNEPTGMCLKCKGRGYLFEITEDLIIRDYNLPLMEITISATGAFADLKRWIPILADNFDFDLNTPYKDLPGKIKHLFLYGSDKKMDILWDSKNFKGMIKDRQYEGVIPHLERAMSKGTSDYRKKKISKNYMKKSHCVDCNGYRLNENTLAIKIHGKHIGELAQMTIDQLYEFLSSLDKSNLFTSEARGIRDLILNKLQSIVDVGLSYLHMNRELPTLSGGELTRLALMSHLGTGLDSILYVLDEPTMGLHEIEKDNLIKILQSLKELGNTVIIVEHDPKLIATADEIIDIGPEAGILGGEIVYQGPAENIKSAKNSLTGKYLTGKLKLPHKTSENRRKLNVEEEKPYYIELKNVTTHNLQKVSVKIPLGGMVGIAGMSGSGKSSLITDTLIPLLTPHFKRGNNTASRKKKSELVEVEEDVPGDLTTSGILTGWEHIDEVIQVNQKPISRVKTSNPASYIGIWDKIRELYAKQSPSKKRKYKPGHFSFNSDHGRCPECKGSGTQDMQISLFLPELSVQCNECKGMRYKSEILEITYKGKTISEVLNMTVKEARTHFEGNIRITKVLDILDRIGMGYITLGQSSRTLSGGEAQRVKLAKELGRQKKEHTLFVLDEPSTGLHAHDIHKLLVLLEELVVKGNSIIIIEHDTSILSYCDWIIELGPEGGPKGGTIIAQGSHESIKNDRNSKIGMLLS